MDIQQWLAETADRAAPEPPSDDHCIPEAFRAHPHRPADGMAGLGRSYRRKRRERASSDSSIIAPRITKRGHAQAASQSLPSEIVRSAGSADGGSTGSAYSSPDVVSSLIRAPEKIYERRPRHKTRPDRYESKHVKRKEQHDARKGKRDAKKRRKSHRSGDGGRTAGLVQSFQLKNGPKNNRLTIRPGATSGLFKHGRASAQVTGRGGGLPDLMFNEMKFLQRPQEHQDAPVETVDRQERSKRDRKRVNEHDISAYFSTKKSAGERQDERYNARKGDGKERPRGPEKRRHDTPPVDLPSRPFLGFGSKGHQHSAKEVRSDRTGYFSWSETPPRPEDAAQSRHVIALAVDAGELCRMQPPRKTSSSRHRDQPAKEDQENRDPSARERRQSKQGQWMQSRRTQGSPLVEIYQPRASKAEDSRKAQRSTTEATSQSLPHYSDQRARDNQQRFTNQDQDGYRTSDILKIHEDLEMQDKPEQVGYARSSQLHHERENQHPESSFSIDRLLDGARGLAVAAEVKPGVLYGSEPEAYGYSQDVPQQPYPATRTWQARGTTAQTSMQHSRPTASRQEQGSSRPSGRLPYNTPLAVPSAEVPYAALPQDHQMAGYHPDELQEQDEMLDDGQELETRLAMPYPVYASIQQAEELAHGPQSRGTVGIHGPLSQLCPSEATAHWQQPEPTSAISLIGRSTSVARTYELEQSGGAARDQGIDGMSGFWKPNKLY